MATKQVTAKQEQQRLAREGKLQERRLVEAQDVFVRDGNGDVRPAKAGKSIMDV